MLRGIREGWIFLLCGLGGCSFGENSLTNQEVCFEVQEPKKVSAASAKAATMHDFALYAYGEGGLFFKDSYRKECGAWLPTQGVACRWIRGAHAFVAYAPAVLNDERFLVPPVVSMMTPIAGLLHVQPSLKAERQTDLRVAREVLRCADASSEVVLRFEHVMAEVRVMAMCGDESKRVRVVGVKLGGVHASGQLNLWSKGDFSGRSGTLWSEVEASECRSYMSGGDTGSEGVVLGRAPRLVTEEGGAFRLLPQQVERQSLSLASAPYLAVLCQISERGDDGVWRQVFPVQLGKYAFLGASIEVDWRAGHRYTYKLSFFSGAEGGAGIVPPEPWDPTNTGTAIDPLPQPGEEYKGELTWSVQEEEWK